MKTTRSDAADAVCRNSYACACARASWRVSSRSVSCVRSAPD